MKILVVTAHPDDEAIWFGSTLYELSQLPDVEIAVICLWGVLEPPGSMQAIQPGYSDLDRKDQFYEACRCLHIARAHLVTEVQCPVTKGVNQSFENITVEFLRALATVGLEKIDLLISHSPYGDEHKHRHHQMLYEFTKAYGIHSSIPFSFFSVLPLPGVSHVPMLHSTRRRNQLHVVNYASCSNGLYFVQFQGHLSRKLEAIRCYKAIDFETHFAGYSAFSLVVENLYFEESAKGVIDALVHQIPEVSRAII